MRIQTRGNANPIVIRNEPLERVKSFPYLGSIISEAGMGNETKRRLFFVFVFPKKTSFRFRFVSWILRFVFRFVFSGTFVFRFVFSFSAKPKNIHTKLIHEFVEILRNAWCGHLRDCLDATTCKIRKDTQKLWYTACSKKNALSSITGEPIKLE